jgi:hypothetical protein
MDRLFLTLKEYQEQILSLCCGGIENWTKQMKQLFANTE